MPRKRDLSESESSSESEYSDSEDDSISEPQKPIFHVIRVSSKLKKSDLDLQGEELGWFPTLERALNFSKQVIVSHQDPSEPGECIRIYVTYSTNDPAKLVHELELDSEELDSEELDSEELDSEELNSE